MSASAEVGFNEGKEFDIIVAQKSNADFTPIYVLFDKGVLFVRGDHRGYGFRELAWIVYEPKPVAGGLVPRLHHERIAEPASRCVRP
jgi:hypothetical protein